MIFRTSFVVVSFGLMQIVACTFSDKQQPINPTPDKHTKFLEKKSQKMVVDSLNSDTFTSANTSGNFSEGQGSVKKKSTEKPNRKRVLQDFTHPFQTPVEIVDETTDPAFDYSSPNECEIILPDTLQ